MSNSNFQSDLIKHGYLLLSIYLLCLEYDEILCYPFYFFHFKIIFGSIPYTLLFEGFWPDGLYTPPSDEAIKWDISQTLALGFNMVRKHVKIGRISSCFQFLYFCRFQKAQDGITGRMYQVHLSVLEKLLIFNLTFLAKNQTYDLRLPYNFE